VLEAGTLSEVIAAVRTQPPRAPVDLVLLDLNMPGMNGFTGLVLIRAEFPALPVVVISASEDAVTVSRALDYGAAGFIPKSAPGECLAEAIGAVLAGDLWFPEHHEPTDRAEDVDLAARLATLTPQQLRVFMMVAAGRLNKQIAHELSVTEATVKAHVTMILRKLGVANRTQAVIAGARLVIDPPQPVSAPSQLGGASVGSSGSGARATHRD
jgi:DNA-binding NarL/FixJ family response regulator